MKYLQRPFETNILDHHGRVQDKVQKWLESIGIEAGECFAELKDVLSDPLIRIVQGMRHI